MAYTKGMFSLANVCAKYKTHRINTALLKLGWVKSEKRKGTLWIGPKPKNEKELLQMANTVVDTMGKHSIQKPKIEKNGTIQMEYPSGSDSAPVHVPWSYQVPTKRGVTLLRDVDEIDAEVQQIISGPKELSELSILWGLFKMRWS